MEFTPSQLKWQESFSLFVDRELIPVAEQNDREEKISAELLQKVADAGYLGSMLPQDYGGLGLDMVTVGLLNEEIGRGCSSVRSLLTVQGMVALAILKWGTPEQRDKWLRKLARGEVIGAFSLTEPTVGSDAKNITMSATLEQDEYVLNGTKKWTTMGQIADLFLVFAQVEGLPTAFLVERDNIGLEIKPIEGLLGARASMIAEIDFKNCRIPKGNLVGSLGTGLSHVALASLDYGRFTIAWGCVGLGQACLNASLKYARKRKQFGASLRQHQLIQKMITGMVTNIKAARALCHHAASLKEAGEPDSIMETWVAKYFASTMVSKVASDAIQIHGANGFSREYHVERFYRDSKVNEIIEGTNEMHEILIATYAFRNI
ncbi:acyl-CoA dehydrogenase [Paenibacillus sp. FSL R7-277]|uniref:acyl-CoA dehydrogenase family protein n=1 Tax=unclassified Paenibacillus TaxID=185978 RepID=UPI0003E25EA5|nr:acyl-CoA dehydrogenase family protein [Paenibacillus sp. FSL R7-277]ETT65432.1 acyl-CoA dehydrogenase [Paenibacillus sp. FSL R7-277]